MEGYYTLREVARKLSMSLWFVRHEVKRGHLRTLKLGKQHFVSPDAYREYLVARGGEVPVA